MLYNGSKSAELPIGARPRTAVKQPPLRLADSDIPRVLNHTHLWPLISVGTTTSIVWAERLLATFTCVELLLFATTWMEWPFVASLLHLFVHAWSTVVQCGVVQHLPC